MTSRLAALIAAMITIVASAQCLRADSPALDRVTGWGAGIGSVDVSMNTEAAVVQDQLGRRVMSAFHGSYSVGGLIGASGCFVYIFVISCQNRRRLYSAAASTVQCLHVTRTYSAPAGDDVALYVAYYGSQRPGVSIHSPLHCLPGTGWEPIDDATLTIATGSVRRVTMQKNLDRVVVIYWYQMHGRAVASEIRSKAYGLFDRVRSGRSEAALVRIAVPIAADTDAAAARGLSFVGDLLPQLAPVL